MEIRLLVTYILESLAETKISRLLSCKTSHGLSALKCIYGLQEAYGLQHFPQLCEHRNVFRGTSHEISVFC